MSLKIPVATPSGKWRFSRWNLIKMNDQRATVSWKRMVNPSLLSIEPKLCKNIDYNNLNGDFPEVKAKGNGFHQKVYNA